MRISTSFIKEIQKETKDEQVQTIDEHTIDVQRKNIINLQKSLEILEIADDGHVEEDVSFEKNFAESEPENFRTPNDFLEPLNEAVAEQIDQLIAKLNDCVEKNE